MSAPLLTGPPGGVDGSVRRLFSGLCLPEVGKGNSRQEPLLAPSSLPPPSWVPELFLGRPCLCKEHISFLEKRKGREESQACWEAEQRVSTRSKQGPRQSVDCRRTEGKGWHCQPLRSPLTTDLGMGARFVAVEPLPAAQLGLPRTGTDTRSLFRFLSGTCWSLES